MLTRFRTVATESGPPTVGPMAAASAAWLRILGLARSLPRSTHCQAAAGAPGLLGTAVYIALKDIIPGRGGVAETQRVARDEDPSRAACQPTCPALVLPLPRRSSV